MVEGTVLGKEVELRDIDRELRRLWDADDARTNASLMNLVIYSEQAGSLAVNSARINELTREHACRAILVSLDRTVPQVSTRAWITAHCHLAGGRKAVCCEQLAFELTGKSTGRMRNVVFSHLNSDLPLVLWWQGELSPRFMESLYSVVDRLIFDSSEWGDPAEGLARIAVAIGERAGRLVAQDLEWTRGFPFRLALASIFDDPAAVRALPGISRVRITGHPGHRCLALQMLAWLATQAGWRAGTELPLGVAQRERGMERFSFEHPDGRPVTVSVEEDAAGPALGCVEMAGGSLEVAVSAGLGSPHLRLRHRSGGRSAECLRPAGPVDATGLVGEQLARGGRNALFLKILPLFRKLLEVR